MSHGGKASLFKLKFRIIYCSGEDPEFPVTELLENSPQSRGWQSPKFCEYPQEIIIQFSNPSRLRQIQFLSHQSKIASKIELFTFIPSGKQALSSQIPLNEVAFNRLGYLSLESNEKSGFQARELKSVYVDAYSLLLKIVLHKCHVNKFNLYNQVGLIAINCMGEISKAKQVMADKDSATFEEMMQLDEVTLERVKALKAAKDKAIKMEDYDEAKRLKQAIERLRSMGTHLAQLEERKKIAIENEDFDAAKIIKTEIDRLRKTALDPAFNQGPYSDQPEPTEQHRPFSGGPDAPYADSAPPERPKGFTKPDPVMGMSRKMGRMDIDEGPTEVKPKMPIHKKELFGSGPSKGPQFPSSDNIYEEEKKMAAPFEPSMPEDIDEQVIPAARNRGVDLEDGGIVDTGDSKPQDVEDIVGDNVKLAQPLIPALGEFTVKKLFSKNWSNRETAIDETIEALYSNGDPDTVTAALGAAAQGLKDKISQVVLKSFDLITAVLSTCQEPASSDAKFYIDDIAAGLTTRVGDNNARIRDKALEVGVELSAHPMGGHNLMVDHLTRTGGKKNVSHSVRQQAGKYKLMSEILINTPVTKPQEQRTCLNFALSGYKNSNKEIRDNAYQCIIELYRVMGESIHKFLDDLRPAQKELLEKGFADVDGIDPNMVQKDDQPRVTIETNITPYGAKGKKKAGPKDGELNMLGESPTKFESSFKADSSNMCNFCGKYEMGWDQEALDVHYWRDCPMLTPCFGCGQVLEISGLNDHILDECDNANAFQQCPRCKEPIPEEEFDIHTEEGQCNISRDPGECNRCPLCHEDISPPGEDGWKQHLLIETCPNNERHP